MEKIEFLAVDEVELTGFLYKGNSKTKDVVLAVHGMSSNCFKKREDILQEKLVQNNIDFFCFNNRGSEIVKYLKVLGERKLGGTAYEDVLDGYEDIVGAILKLKELGYENIYLYGHSLGSTKIVYTYNELLEENDDTINNIKGVFLASLIDIPKALKMYTREKYEEIYTYAIEKEKIGKEYELMPPKSSIHPISVKSFLRYLRDNDKINFAQYGINEKFEKLNNIKSPIFMRWGNVNEFILQNAEDLVQIVEKALQNKVKDIGYIDGADHGYSEKEEQLAEEVVNFIKKIK